MGKNQTVKKRGSVREDNGRDIKNEDVNINTPDDIEERIRRLEKVQTTSGGTSDVYKFAFFFFMGIALTILLYPGISRTIESLSESNGKSEKGVRSAPYSEDFRSVDDSKDVSNETFMGDDVKVKSGKTIFVEVPKQNTAKKQQVDKDDEKEKLKTVNENRIEDSLIGELAEEDTAKTIVLESMEETLMGYNQEMEETLAGANQELEEDTYISETKSGQTIISKSVDVNSDKPERVELFSANIDDIPERNEPIQREPPLKSKNTPKHQKSKKETTKMKLKKEKKWKKLDTKTKEELAENENKDKNIPQEIKDFKPTYLKGIIPKKIFADGRRIPPMELLPQKPNNSSVKVWMFEEFLSEAECDGLMRVHNKHVEEQSKEDPVLCFDSVTTLRKHLKNVGKNVNVTPRDFTQGTTCVNASFSTQLKDWFNGNWSYSTAFYPGESRFASIFEHRVKEAMGLLPENGGKFQITSYPKGIGYKTHTDCTENNEDKRDRVATVLVYLDTVTEGGETEFPELGIWVRPRKARALLWNNMNEEGDCEPLSIHKAAKVGNGHKFILQRWYYYKSFYSLGKRPPEPPLPPRRSGQPRVSCDEYENGSCRWYDEWNFEHIVEYEKRKYTLV